MMTSAAFKETLERLGWIVAHARRVPRKPEIRAYLAMRNEEYPDVDELRYNPAKTGPGTAELIKHAVKPNGYTSYDLPVGLYTFAGG